MWIARDRGDSLYLYRVKPIKMVSFWDSSCDSIKLDRDLFPEIKWEDEEPTEVEFVIKKKL